MGKYIVLNNFKGFELDDKTRKQIFDAVSKAGERTEKEIKSQSPKGDNHRANKYSDTWSTYKNKDTLSAIVKNEKNYRLTHLLEYGHLIVNKKGGVGWAAPKPHISSAFDATKDAFFEDMKDVDIEIKVI